MHNLENYVKKTLFYFQKKKKTLGEKAIKDDMSSDPLLVLSLNSWVGLHNYTRFSFEYE